MTNIVLTPKKCVGVKCAKTFKVMDKEKHKAIWCSSSCKSLHAVMGWKQKPVNLREPVNELQAHN